MTPTFSAVVGGAIEEVAIDREALIEDVRT